MKKLLALVCALAMALSLAACGGQPEQSTAAPTKEETTTKAPVESTPAATEPATTEAPEPEKPADYVYKDSVTTLSTNWNPHTYQTTD